jgi:FG-GAP-like repeat
LADFNGDGQPDIVFENKVTGQRVIWVMSDTSHVGNLSLPNPGTDWTIAGAADFNADNKPDILWQNKVTGERAIWMMNGPSLVNSVYLPTVTTEWSMRNF